MANTYYKMLNNKITNPQGDVLNRYVENIMLRNSLSPTEKENKLKEKLLNLFYFQLIYFEYLNVLVIQQH